MFVRASCLTILCVSLTAGCQTPASALFPWPDNLSQPNLTEAEPDLFRDEPELNSDASGGTVQTNVPEFPPVSATHIDNLEKERWDRIQSWLRRGHEAIRQAGSNGRPDAMLSEAIRSFREVLKVDPECADAFHGMAIVSDLTQDWELSDFSYKRALAIRPNDVDLLNDQGYSYLLQNRYQEASQYLSRALQLSPGHEKAHINLAILDIKRGYQDAALVKLENIYPAAQARSALVSLSEQHLQSSLSGSSVRPAVNSGTQLAGSELPQHVYPSRHTPLIRADQHGTVRADHRQLTDPHLFSAEGLIRTQSSRSEIQPVRAAGQREPIQVSSAAMHRLIDSTGIQREPSEPSPLSSARTVGRPLQTPLGHDVVGTTLPASAHVYNPDTPSTSRLSVSNQESTQLPPEMSVFHSRSESVPVGHSAQLQHPQYQQPVVQPRLSPPPRHQISAFSRYNDGISQANNFSSNTSLPAPVAGTGNRGTFMPQSGAFYRGTVSGRPVPGTAAQPGIQGFHNQYIAPREPGQSFGSHGYPQNSSPQMSTSTTGLHNGGVTNPAGWGHPVASGAVQPFTSDQHRQRYPGPQQPTGSDPVAGNSEAHIGPGYFSPPPVMGRGYRDPAAAAPDGLAEYRRTREQLENEHNQTLQRLGRPGGGPAVP